MFNFSLAFIKLLLTWALFLPGYCCTQPELTADEILDLLDAEAAELKDFEANFRFDKYEDILESTTVNTGKLIFKNNQVSNTKNFAVQFQRTGEIVKNDDGVSKLKLHARSTFYIFDGVWLVEKNFEDKQFIKRQIVAPGEKFDPFSLDEGIFPMPVGQAKKDIISQYDVKLAKLDAVQEDSFLLKVLKDKPVYGLNLIPIEGTPAAKEYERVLIYYDQDTLLPTGIEATKKTGNIDTVILGGFKKNQGVDEKLLSTALPPKNENWMITQEGLDKGED